MSSMKSTTPQGNPNAKELTNYQLGDVLGKGASGQVYRALNWTTGETVAVKQIQLSNIPKAELAEIMSEIDLLRNLNHPNIVKYKGFVKTREYLNIILEYCENGSLQHICKRFGKFPESLVAVYISQVLVGLVYLHDQGVIHRDIKGANILTNKDGCVKLADFGVASASGVNDGAVVGSPYWMAPEVIEQFGATTASDIWSVGCVVIELLDGQPPYHQLKPMPALFRIVQDDCPPIPEGASPIVKDFLYHCFQKDPNLRISAKKLLRHPWMVSARKSMGAERNTTERPTSNYGYDEAVTKVREWNEALKSPSRTSKRAAPRVSRPSLGAFNMVNSPLLLPAEPPSIVPSLSSGSGFNTSSAPGVVAPVRLQATVPEEETDNWDDDFDISENDGINVTKLHAAEKDKESMISKTSSGEEENTRTIRPSRSPAATTNGKTRPSPMIEPILEDWTSDLGEDDDDDTQMLVKVAEFKSRNTRRGLFHPDDIKTVGLSASPGPQTAPLPRTQSPDAFLPDFPSPGKRASPLPRTASPLPPRSATATPTTFSKRPNLGHGRSSSSSVVPLAGASSLGRADGRRLSSGNYNGLSTPLTSPSEVALQQYTEDEDDEDYDDVFAKVNGSEREVTETLQLNTRLSNKSWLGDDDFDEEDPFAEIDEGFAEEDLESNLVRDKYARLCSAVNQLVDELKPDAPDFTLRDHCDQLLMICTDAPEMQLQVISSHGMLAVLEVLESKPSRDVILKLLQIINVLVTADLAVLESFCLIGGIPVVMEFTSKKFSQECRQEASNFIRLLCHSSVLTLQMFISCRGLKVLVDLLDESYAEQTELVVHALNGISSVFELQSPTTKNDFCRMFIREGLLDPLTAALSSALEDGSPVSEQKSQIIGILLVFCQVSQSDQHVRSALAVRKVIRRLLRACEVLEPEYLVVMLKAVKHLSMNSNLLDVLQNANAIEVLIRIMVKQSSGPHSTEISNHIFQTLYNLCRLNKSRQEEAAQAGIIPCLRRVSEGNSPLKQFALPILCDLASAGKACRAALWQHDGLQMYLKLLSDPYFQVSALEAILSWLQDETARVEDVLMQQPTLDTILKCFVSSKANSFENLLDPLLKIIRLSTPVALGLAKGQFFRRLIDRLGHAKAVVRLNLLRILRAVCDVHPERTGLIEQFGLYGIVDKLARQDGAVLVRELAREIVPTLSRAPSPAKQPPPSSKSVLAPKKKSVRRTASEASVQLPPGISPLVGTSTARSRLRPSRHRLEDVPWNPQHSSSGSASGSSRR
ncbi:hypothetical protein EXIGLDRAFT_837889 [Exidia glandulosa HHB12029]|uniref:non-specific serine/threonine protein kinase n=1 Tax=Exidia glandulosa HHB12029 TaxID=1314781 RepID=A0A166AB30_EXIGL|nr:hypothetical protein EXIGLDRAFT_837889 [Exidia glandulosa HHB12029]